MLSMKKIKKATVQTYSTPEIRIVNLGITGINNPDSITNDTSEQSNGSGNYVYFGDYYQSNTHEKDAIKWRVLNIANDSNGNNKADSLLLQSEKVLDVIKFNENRNDGQSWAGSNIKNG